MDIQTNTEFVCNQIQDELLAMYDVIFCNIEPQGDTCVLDTCIPKTDAEIGIRINPNQTVEVIRVNPDAASRALLEWALEYLDKRNFIRIVA